MKKSRTLVSALLITASILLPLTAAADVTDDLIMEMMRALEGTSAPVVAASSTATSTPVPKATAPKTSSTSVIPPIEQPVLGPLFIFGIDGNTPKSDPQIEGMKGTVELLLAKIAALTATATSSNAATTTATTTPAEPTRQTFTRDLTIGSRGEDVRQLQTLLIARGFLFGEVTGYYGILTKTAVIAFQTDNGLPPVGNVGPRTRALLNDMPQGPGEAAPQLIIGPPARPLTASSTSLRSDTGTSTGTSTPSTGTSTPLYDPFYPPVSVSMSILPQEAPVGGSVALTWLSQNATSCVASDGWDGVRPTLGAARIEPLQFSLNFVITCEGPGGIASTSALVVVGGEQ